MTAVELAGVRKSYAGRTVVDDVSLSLAPGERLALLGHNGAGKTTIMKMMLGVTRPSGGRVRTLGADPAALDAATRRSIGFLPENLALYDSMTGWEILTFYARLKRRPAAECGALLERVGLAEAAKRRVGTYSKGMRQRLGLAQALLGPPRLLLLDEPTTGLDPELRQGFYELIRDLRQAGVAVLLSSHLLTELEEHADRIAIMDRGRLVAEGRIDDLRNGAGLPVRFRVRGNADAILRRLDGAVWDEDAVAFACPPTEKMAVLRRLAEMGPAVADIDMQPPTLDDVYAHFTGGSA